MIVEVMIAGFLQAWNAVIQVRSGSARPMRLPPTRRWVPTRARVAASFGLLLSAASLFVTLAGRLRLSS